jgi:TolA-binding protein
LVALALAAPAAAAPPAHKGAVRYDREGVKPKVQTTLSIKVQAAQKLAKTKPGAPTITAADWEKKRESATQEILDEQIVKLRRLIGQTAKSDPDMPELLFRLADLWLEKVAYFERQAGSLYDPIHAAETAKNKPLAQSLRAKQAKFRSQQKAAAGKAVDVFRVLARDSTFASYKRLDEAIYYLAFELGRLGREAEMKEAYVRLVREFPTSKFVASAYLNLADSFFAKSQIPDALKLYERIIEGYPDSPVYAYALYKIAWCHLNPIGTAEPQYAKSLDAFVATIAATLAGKAGNEANGRQLRRDARRDLVRAFVHSGKPSKAFEFFEKVGNGPHASEDMAKKMMELLAVAYFGEGMYVESTATYRKLQDVFAKDEDVCHWQAQVVVNALATDDSRIQWIETERLAEIWNAYAGAKHPEPVKRKCRNDARDTLMQMATVWHDEAAKTHKPETYALAEKAYAAFLARFPTDAKAYELGYYHAELLWAQAHAGYGNRDAAVHKAAREKFRAAHDAFRRVLEKNPKGKYTRDAAYAQMLALKNHLEYDETGGSGIACRMSTDGVCVFREARRGARPRNDGRIDVAKDFPATDYTADEAAMLAAYDTYEKYVKDKKDPELPKILYHRVKLMMEHNRFVDAKPLATELVTKFDGTIYAAWAAEMLVDALTLAWADATTSNDVRRERGAELERWSAKLQTSKAWSHAEADRVRTQVPTLLAAVAEDRAKSYMKDGEAGDPQAYVKCAQEYVEIWNAHENHEKADILLFNAARCYEAAYLVGLAVKMRSELVARYPKSTVYRQTLRELGENYQAIAFYGEAAEKYEHYAAEFPKDAYSAQALQNAYLFRLGRGEDKEATSDLDKYEAIYRKKDVALAAKIFWSKHALLDDDTERLAHARAYLADYGGKGGLDRQAVAEAAIGQILWRQSCSEPLKYDSCVSVRRRKANTGESERHRAEILRDRTGKRRSGIPKFCGTDTQALVTVHKRDEKKVAEAMAHFAAVAKIAAKTPKLPTDDDDRVEAYRNAVGMAMVYTADRGYEEYLALEIPQELWFGAGTMLDKKDHPDRRIARSYELAVAREAESAKRFIAWRDRKVALGKDLRDRYLAVTKSGSPSWTLAAAARTALVHRNFADQLYRAPIPETIRTEDEKDSYCDELAKIADPELETAKKALRYCLGRSTEFQFFNEFSRMCEEELQQSDADEFPATNELFGASVYTDSRLDVLGVQTEIAANKPAAPRPR